jgi:hypothetical protein
LEDQLLGDVVRKEKPEIEVRGSEMEANSFVKYCF